MLGNYYILARIMKEFAPRAIGTHLEKAVSSISNELSLVFDSGVTLYIHVLPGHSYFYFKESESTNPKRNYATFFRDAYRQKLIDITISETDKHYTLVFEHSTIDIRLYDNPNVFFNQNALIESFKKEKEYLKQVQTPVEYALLGNLLKKEFAFRKIEPHIPDTRGALVYTLPSSRLLLSPVELKHVDTQSVERFESANEAAKRVLFTRKKRESFITKKTQLLSELTTYIARLQETIRQAEEHRNNYTRAERYQTIADALMSVAHEHSNGLDEIQLRIGERCEIISLDPSLTVFANADKFYGKARHSRNAKKELISKIDSFNSNLSSAQSIAERATISIRESDLETLIEEATRRGFLVRSQSKKASAEPTFREFIIHGGYLLLVGKNAKQNDELTMHVAGKEDIWLHARHVSGSHAVIRSKSRTDVIPKETIIAAAEIAAYYSDAKSQKVAPVAYTKRKYVRKPRKALPGQVILEKEEVVLVEPKLPTIK